MKKNVIGAINFFVGLIVILTLFLPQLRSGEFEGNLTYWLIILVSFASLISGPLLVFKSTALGKNIYTINIVLLIIFIGILLLFLGLLLLIAIFGLGFEGMI
jgi:hypothetical protein